MILSVAAFSFLAGSWYGARGSGGSGIVATDTPGSAPSGVPHEPIHAGTMAGQEGMDAAMPPGTVTISPARQQLIGVKVAAVEKKPMTYTLRLYGRVVPDETKTYRLNASTDSWVREISSATTGSLVEKNEILAEMLAPAYLQRAEQLRDPALGRWTASGSNWAASSGPSRPRSPTARSAWPCRASRPSASATPRSRSWQKRGRPGPTCR